MSEVTKTNNFDMMVDMPEEMVVYLNQLSTKAQKGGNNKIGISEITRAAIRGLLMENEVAISGVQDEEELTERILGFSRKQNPIEVNQATRLNQQKLTSD
jgi:hypothetical protein